MQRECHAITLVAGLAEQFAAALECSAIELCVRYLLVAVDDRRTFRIQLSRFREEGRDILFRESTRLYDRSLSLEPSDMPTVGRRPVEAHLHVAFVSIPAAFLVRTQSRQQLDALIEFDDTERIWQIVFETARGTCWMVKLCSVPFPDTLVQPRSVL